jgi:hypothetical protein
MPQTPTRADHHSRSSPPEECGVGLPTLADEFLQTACTIARGRMAWTPGPGHDTEDLPWLKGVAAA